MQDPSRLEGTRELKNYGKNNNFNKIASAQISYSIKDAI